MDDVARIIDRLLCLLDSHDYNAVDDAVRWLIKYADDEEWLSVKTRDLMDKYKQGVKV